MPPTQPQVPPFAPGLNAAQLLDELLVEAGRGSTHAYEAVYMAVMPQVYRLAVRIVRDPTLAEDVAQDALVEAWRKAATFEPSRGTARAWILTITHRRAVDRVRREQRQRDQVDLETAMVQEPAPPQDEVVEIDYSQWQSARVRGAMKVLSERQREAIEAVYYRGRTQVEASQDLGVPLGTAKTRIRDGLSRLKTAMKEVES